MDGRDIRRLSQSVPSNMNRRLSNGHSATGAHPEGSTFSPRIRKPIKLCLTLSLFSILYFVLIPVRRSYAYTENVHEHITREALALLQSQSQYYSTYESLWSHLDNGSRSNNDPGAGNDIIDGVWGEDRSYDYNNGRFYNHFYRATDGARLSGAYALTTNTHVDALTWSGIVAANSTNSYDYQDALRYYRERNFNKAFFALGHVVHLIQDMSVPAHVHDDKHGVENVAHTGNGYEQWCTNNYNALATYAKSATRLGVYKTGSIQDYLRNMATTGYNANSYYGKLTNYDNNYSDNSQWDEIVVSSGSLNEQFAVYFIDHATNNYWHIYNRLSNGNVPPPPLPQDLTVPSFNKPLVNDALWRESDLGNGYGYYYFENHITNYAKPKVANGKSLAQYWATETLLPDAISYSAGFMDEFINTVKANLTITAPNSTTQWYRGNITVSATATGYQNIVKISQIEFQYNLGSGWIYKPQTYPAPSASVNESKVWDSIQVISGINLSVKIRARAMDEAGVFSSWVESVQFKVDNQAPDAVSSFATDVYNLNNQVRVSWTNPATSDFTGVLILRFLSSSSNTLSEPANGSSYTANSFIGEG